MKHLSSTRRPLLCKHEQTRLATHELLTKVVAALPATANANIKRTWVLKSHNAWCNFLTPYNQPAGDK